MFLSLYLFFGATLSAFVKGISGFANTLILVSLYAFVLPSQLITPTDLILGFPANVYMLWLNRKGINFKEVFPVIGLVVLGIIPGTFILQYGNPVGLKIILSLVIMGLAVEMMTRKRMALKRKPPGWLLIVIALVSGLMIGMYGIGALLVAYFDRTCVNKNQFRANICAVFLADNLYRICHYIWQGIFTWQVGKLALFAFPGIIAGFWLSYKVDAKISEETVRRAVIVTLFVSGALLLLKTLFFPA